MQALSKKKTGDICTIKWMFGIPEILDFLRKAACFLFLQQQFYEWRLDR